MDSIADEGQCPAWGFMDKVCDASVKRLRVGDDRD